MEKFREARNEALLEGAMLVGPGLILKGGKYVWAAARGTRAAEAVAAADAVAGTERALATEAEALLAERTAPGAGVAPNAVPEVKVINIEGPLHPGELGVPGRSLKSDFKHVDLSPDWPNTLVADVNSADLSQLVGNNVRFTRASNVPFTEGRYGATHVNPTTFVEQVEKSGAKHIVVTTGKDSFDPLVKALEKAGWEVKIRRFEVSGRASEDLREVLQFQWGDKVPVITARRVTK